MLCQSARKFFLNYGLDKRRMVIQRGMAAQRCSGKFLSDDFTYEGAQCVKGDCLDASSIVDKRLTVTQVPSVLQCFAERKDVTHSSETFSHEKLKGIFPNALQNVPYLLHVGHLRVAAFAQREDVFYIGHVRLLRSLNAGAKGLLGVQFPRRWPSKQILKSLCKLSPILKFVFVVEEPGFGYARQVERNVV